jgi:hypothetical protein
MSAYKLHRSSDPLAVAAAHGMGSRLVSRPSPPMSAGTPTPHPAFSATKLKAALRIVWPHLLGIFMQIENKVGSLHGWQ